MPEQTLLHYQILDTLGAGGMGVVYRAVDTRLDRSVALKFLPESLALDATARQRLLLEAKAAAALDHPNIGVIHSIEGLEDRPFIVMALYQGESLRQKLDRGPLDVAEAADICLQSARGLARAHEAGIVHRDIKPANLFLTSQGLLKILDFGLARRDELDGLTKPGGVVGTLEYMSPEQLRGQTADARADLWALGVVLYEMLTGISPFRAEGGVAACILKVLRDDPVPLGSLRPEAGRDLESVVEKALSKDLDARYGSAQEMIADLEGVRLGVRGATASVSATATFPPQQAGEPGPSGILASPAGAETPAPVNVLPRPATPLVGRQDELAVVALNLADPQCRILTLMGPGGTGKTRLAQEAAHAQVELAHFSGGIFFVPLDVISDGELVPTRIAEVLGIGLQGQEDVLSQVIGHIGDKRMLLVLDNFEQLMDAALLVSDLVQACPRLTVLVTSRERLNLEEEWVLPVQGLQLPAQADISLEEAQRCEAIQLFVQRARRVQLGFALLQQDLPHVSRVCHLVQGLPLGLELAAAWVKMTSCAEIAREIQANLDFLASSSRNVNERHKSLRATFEYSWKLLSPGEQDVLRRLSVFRGGFAREAAQAVAQASLAALASLVDKSLLQTAPEGRYDLHPLLHQYCREKLAERPEEQAETEERHGNYFERFLQDSRTDLRGPRQAEVQRAIERELENVRTAWLWAVNGKRAESLLESGPSLDIVFDNTGRYREAAATFGQAADALNPADPNHHAALGEMLASQAFALFRLGRYQEGAATAERSLSLLRPLGRIKGIESALNSLGAIAAHTGEYDQARRYWQELLEIVKAHDGPRELALILGNLGTLEYALGNYAQAKKYGQESLELNRKLNLAEGIVSSLNNLGNVLLSMGEAKEAQPLLEEGLRLAQEANHQLVIPRLLGLLGDVFYELGDYERAKVRNEEALLLAREHGDQAVEASRLRSLGTLAVATGDFAQAQTFFEKSLHLHLAIQALPSAMNAVLGLAQLNAERGQPQEALSLLALTLHHPATDAPVKDEARGLLEEWQSRLSPEAVREALDRGRAMRLEEVVA